MTISPSTPIPCRSCFYMRPLSSPLRGVRLPGDRCKCIVQNGPCSKIAKDICGTTSEPGQGGIPMPEADR